MTLDLKVKKSVREALPKGEHFRVIWDPTGIGGYQVLRVITPAWSSLPRFERIFKIQNALKEKLTPAEHKKILRVSVLTEDEFKRLASEMPRRTSNLMAPGASR